MRLALPLTRFGGNHKIGNPRTATKSSPLHVVFFSGPRATGSRIVIVWINTWPVRADALSSATAWAARNLVDGRIASPRCSCQLMLSHETDLSWEESPPAPLQRKRGKCRTPNRRLNSEDKSTGGTNHEPNEDHESTMPRRQPRQSGKMRCKRDVQLD